jgi:hypothetical protein
MSLKLLALAEQFSEIIDSVRINRFEQAGASLRLRATMQLTDGSRLFIRETIIQGMSRKYAYHWQDKDGKMIVRWDNAPDWDVKTFPHHKHVGHQKEVAASYERTIDQALLFISERIKMRH